MLTGSQHHVFLGASTTPGREAFEIGSAGHFAELAADHAGARITIQGAGHSAGPIAHPTDGVLFRSRAESGRVTVEGETATLDTRLTWLAAEQVLNRQGRSFPVLTDYLYTTVGGTLSVGGIGFGSIEYGPQVHNVLSLRLVALSGELIQAGPLENADVFRSALAGLGQFGWIEDVTVRTIPARPRVAANVYRATSLDPYIAMLREVEAFAHEPRGLQFSSYISGDGYFVEVAVPAVSTEAQLLSQRLIVLSGSPPIKQKSVGNYSGLIHFEREVWLTRYPNCRFFWSDFVLDFEGMHAFLRYFEEALGGARSPHLGMINVLAIRRPAAPIDLYLQPFSALGPGWDYSVGVYYNVPDAEESAKAAAVEALRTLGDRCADLGGRPYMYGLLPSEKLRRRFEQGPGYAVAMDVKRRLDPLGRLGSLR